MLLQVLANSSKSSIANSRTVGYYRLRLNKIKTSLWHNAIVDGKMALKDPNIIQFIIQFFHV